MSKAIVPAVPEPPKYQKRTKVGFKIKMALLEVIERKQVNYQIDYRVIAARHDTTAASLRKYYAEWRRGRIDLGEAMSAEEKHIDARMQHEKTIQLLQRHQAVLLNYYEGAIYATEDAASKREPNAFENYGLPKLLAQLSKVIDLKANAEKGYSAILDEFIQNREKGKGSSVAPPPGVTDVQATKVVTANDEARALAAFDSLNGNGNSEPAPTPAD